MRAEKFSFLLVCALVIELFIVALILAVYFMSQLLRQSTSISPSLYRRQLLTLAFRRFYIFFILKVGDGLLLRECHMRHRIVGLLWWVSLS